VHRGAVGFFCGPPRRGSAATLIFRYVSGAAAADVVPRWTSLLGNDAIYIA